MIPTAKPVCLIVCGNTQTAARLKEIVQPYQQPWMARTVEDALDSLGCHPATVIAENVEHSSQMIDFLKVIRARCPNAKRVLVTEACNLALVVAALHSGAVDHLVYQPLDAREIVPLLLTVTPASSGAAAGRNPLHSPLHG